MAFYIKLIRKALESLSAIANKNINWIRNIENRAAVRISALTVAGGGGGRVSRQVQSSFFNSPAQLEDVVVLVYLFLIFGQLIRLWSLSNVVLELLLKS